MKNLFLILVVSLLTAASGFGQCTGPLTLSTQAEVSNFSCNSFTGDLTIQGPDISDISSLNSLQSISGALTIRVNPLLTSIVGLNSLNSAGSINITTNASLVEISGFNSISNTGTVFISNNANLTNLSGFNDLEVVGSLHVLQSSQLEVINGFEELSSITTTLNLQNTPTGQSSLLCDCQVLAPALNAGLPTNLFFNNSVTCSSFGCNDVQSVISSFCDQDFVLTTQQEVDDFFCTSVRNLTITGSAISNLSGLSSLETIDGELFIDGTTNLQSLTGLQNLRSATTVRVSQTTGLTDLAGLSGLTDLDELFLFRNSNLGSIVGLTGIDQLEILNIRENNALTDVSAFQNLEVVSNDIRISDNTSLQACGAFLTAISSPFSAEAQIFGNISSGECDSGAAIQLSQCMPTRAPEGRSLSLDGDQKIVVENPVDMAVSSALTMESWINPKAPFGTNGQRIILNKEGEYQLLLEGGEIQFSIGNDQNFTIIPTGKFVHSDLWTHVAVTYDGASYVVYVNGEACPPMASTGLIIDQNTAENEFTIGGRQAVVPNPNLFLGSIDEVRIWDVARTAQEIADNFETELVGTENGLIGYFTFDYEREADEIPDLSVNQNFAVFDGTGSLTYDAMIPCVADEPANVRCAQGLGIGNSLSFDGVDDYVDINTALTGLDGLSDFSVEFWMKADAADVSGPRSMMFSHNAPAPGDNKFLLILNGQSISNPGRLSIVDEDNGFELTSQAVVGDGLWHQVTYSRENGTGSLYIDGVLDGTHPSITTFSINDRLSLGQDFDGNNTSDFFNGNLADVRIWATPRTPSQIAASQQSELSGVVEDLVAYYKFENDGTSPAVLDCSPNSFDGSRIGANGPNNLPQFVADMPCIEDQSCEDVLFPEISIIKTVSDYAPTGNGNVDITFEIVVSNTGTTDLTDLELYDDLVTQFGTAFVDVSTPTVIQQPASSTISVSTFYTGNNVNILTGGSSLVEGETFTLSLTAELNVDEMSTGMSNVSNMTSNTESGGTGATAAATSAPAMISDCFAAIPGHLTCNVALQQSVSNVTEMCMVTIDPTIVLEGEDEDCFGPGMPLEGFYRISLSETLNGSPIVVSDNDDDPSTTDVIEFNLSDFIGENLFFTITELGSNPNSCSGRILIEDKVAPVVTGVEEFMVTCLEDISQVNPPIITDNCGNPATNLTIASTDVPSNISPCGQDGEFLLITRTTTVTDASGNTSDPFVQTITVKQVTPAIPADVTYTCEQFAADNTIVDATVNGAGVPNVSTAQTGVGPATCNFDVRFEDELVEKCGSTNGRFVILRTWSIDSNCDNDSPVEMVQTITVTDMVNPVIDIPTTFTIEANVAGSNNSTCSSSGLLPVPVLSDNCSGIDPATLMINTPAGEATAVVAGGQVVGYEIPSPFLGIGGPYSVTYTVMDSCDNSTTVEMLVTVEDNTPPVTTCDELTVLSLTNTSETVLPAVRLDDGSYDLCSPEVYFKVIRMDEASGTPIACNNANVNSSIESTATSVYFDDEAFFCCEDISNNPIMVMLRVFDVDPGVGAVDPARMLLGGDLFGRFNECMVEVTVQDKLAPQVFCPAPRTLVCTDLATIQQYTDENNTSFDAPQVIDACTTTTTLSINDATNSCGSGTITRTFTITDSQGQSSSCTQTITVILEHDYSILWPNDVEVSMCQVGVFGDTLSRPNSLIENGCDLLAVSYTDQRFETQSTGCYKILRTYDVINWCEWDGSSAAIGIPNPRLSAAGPRLDVTASAATGNQSVLVNGQTFINAVSAPNQVQSIGRWSYTQHIKVYDNEDPVISNIAQAACDASTPTPGIVCGQAVSVSFDLTDNCGNLYPVTYQLVEGASDTDGNGQISASELAQGTALSSDPYGTLLAPAGSTNRTSLAGTFTLTGNYPVGNYVAVLDVRDQCGNVSELYVPFTSEDCKPPTPIGIDITVGIMATGMIDVWASDVENPHSPSFDGCGDVRLSFSADVTDSVRTFTYTDLGDQIVQLWVTDLAGNQSFVSVTVTIEDQSGHCGSGNASRVIAGTIANPIGNTVEGVHVSASGGYLSSMTTASNGQFAFYRINNGANVSITPERLDQPYAGITTYDLYLIGQHILGNTLLQSPEQLIAADASNDGRITAFDITSIRRVLLGADTEFANNTSWRFVDAGYVFPNPSNPWQEAFPEVMDYHNLTQDMMNTDFTAIKVGDLNNSAAVNSRQVLAPRTLTGEFALEAKNAVLPKGESHIVSFKASDLDVLGYQLTLEWNPADVEVVNIISGSHPAGGFGKHLLENGKLTMSHDGDMNGTLFRLEVRALRDGIALSEVFTAGSSITQAEAFAKTGEQSVALRFSGQATRVGNTLEQNRPNPFAGTTQIGFTLAEAGAATLTITDVTGRVVWRTAGQFDAGLNQVEIFANELPNAGLLNYTLTAGDFTATRKMVVVK